MPRFFFDFDDGDGLVQDDTGTELEHAEAAHREAISALPEMARGLLTGGGDHREILVRVRDEAGQQVLRARLTFVVERSA